MVIRYLLINKLRTIKRFFLSYTQIILVSISLLVVAISIFSQYVSIVSSYLPYLICLICAYQFYGIIFHSKPEFLMSPEIFHYAFNTDFFKGVRTYLLVKKVLAIILVTAVLTVLLCFPNFNLRCVINFVYLFVFLFVCSILRWIKYKELKLIYLLLLSVLSIISYILTAVFSDVFFIAQSAVTILVFIVNKKSRLDLGKYIKDITYLSRADRAARSRNLADMQQVALESLSFKDYKVKLFNFPLSQEKAVFYLAIIELLRTRKKLMAILLLLLLLCASFKVLPIDPAITSLVDTELYIVIMKVIISAVITVINDIYYSQVSSLCDKSQKGFFVPYTRLRILISYAVPCFSLLFTLLLPGCLLIGTSPVQIAVIMLSSAVLFTITLYLASVLKSNKSVIVLLAVRLLTAALIIII